MQLDDLGHVTVSMSLPYNANEVFEAYFPEAFPDEAPEIYVPEALRVKAVALPENLAAAAPLARDVWPAEGEIADRFITCVKRLCGQLPPPIAADDLEEPEAPKPADTKVTVEQVKKQLLK